MFSESLISPSSFKSRIQKRMLHLRNLESFGTQTINMLMKINLTIDIASQYIHPVKKLFDIGIICDANIIAFQKSKLSKYFYVSSFLLEKCLKKESIFPIKFFLNEDFSEEFLDLMKNGHENPQNWLYFYIPFSIDSYHIQCLIENKKCGLHSILKNKQEELENVTQLKSQFNINQFIFKNQFEVKNDANKVDSKIIKNCENSINDGVFLKQLRYQLPRKIENDQVNDVLSNNNNNNNCTFIFRINFGDFLNDFVAKSKQTEPTLENIIPDKSTNWKPFVF